MALLELRDNKLEDGVGKHQEERNQAADVHDTNGVNEEEIVAARTTRDWQDVAVEASITAEAGGGYWQRNVYTVDEYVLVFLAILNMLNRVDAQEDFTVKPVNKHGFPKGRGETFDERGGPYNYVLCKIVMVHHDEDEPYYTVVRGDTGSEQRADTAWIEPIESLQGLQEASRAAKQTGTSFAVQSKRTTCWKCIKGFFFWWI